MLQSRKSARQESRGEREKIVSIWPHKKYQTIIRCEEQNQEKYLMNLIWCIYICTEMKRHNMHNNVAREPGVVSRCERKRDTTSQVIFKCACDHYRIKWMDIYALCTFRSITGWLWSSHSRQTATSTQAQSKCETREREQEQMEIIYDMIYRHHKLRYILFYGLCIAVQGIY